MLDRYGTLLELKAVDGEQRVIEGYAAIIGTEDRVGDVIEPGAFDRTLAGRDPADIPVFIAHKMDGLPVGIPLEVRADARGLYTKTRILRTQAGDDLLTTAREYAALGRSLGMSIGYKAEKFDFKTSLRGGRRRHIAELYLGEFSYAAPQIIAHQDALVHSVKTLDADERETLVADVLAALEEKAVLSTDARNALPDGAFAYISPDGTRHFPYKHADGTPDEAHVRNALSRIPQASTVSAEGKAEALRKVHAAAKELGIDTSEGKTIWQGGEVKALDALGVLHQAIASGSANADQLKQMHDMVCPLGMDCPAMNQSKTDAGSASWLAAISSLVAEHKAGAKMAKGDLADLHAAMQSMSNLHKSQCSGDNCPLDAEDVADKGKDEATEAKTRENILFEQQVRELNALAFLPALHASRRSASVS